MDHYFNIILLGIAIGLIFVIYGIKKINQHNYPISRNNIIIISIMLCFLGISMIFLIEKLVTGIAPYIFKDKYPTKIK